MGMRSIDERARDLRSFWIFASLLRASIGLDIVL